MTIQEFPRPPATSSSDDPLADYVRASDLHGRVFNRTWVVEGLIEEQRLYEVFGRWKEGKTIAVMDMAAHACTGRTWGDRRTVETLVVYVAGEAVEDIEQRLAAWQLHKDITAPIPFMIRTKPVYLTQQEFAQRLYQELKAWRQEFPDMAILLVIDTLNRNFGPGNENSVEDMGAFTNNLIDVVVRPSGCTCLVVHHTGHGDSDRGRGHSSFAGAVDGSIKVSMDKSSGQPVVTVATKTSRSTEGSDQLSFRIETQVLPGSDNFGNEVSAPVLRYQPNHTPPVQQNPSGKHGHLLKAITLELAIQQYQTIKDSGCRIPDTVSVLLADIRKEFDLKLKDQKSVTRRQAWRNNFKKLKDMYPGPGDGCVFCSVPKGVAGFDDD